MIRVCFQSAFISIDAVSKELLRSELTHLATKDPHLEFWFTGCHNDYEKIAVECIKELKAQFTNSQIEIVSVIDPIKIEKHDSEKIGIYRDGFPSDTVTKTEYAPRIEGKCELLPNRFVEHSRKVFRWVVDQCDVLFAFYYEGVPDYTNTEIKRFRKKGNIEIIPIFNPEIAEDIDNYIENLEGREKIVLQGIRAGRTYKSLSEELEISQNRVQQISHHAIRYMMRAIRHKIYS